MTVTEVNTATFLSDSVMILRDDLLANITDPISSKRSNDEKFVMTAYPQRAVKYPIITIKHLNPNAPRKLGIGSLLHRMNLPIEIRVWSLSMTQRDQLTQQVLNRLRTIELSSFAIKGLHDFKVNSTVPVEYDGDNGLKSFIIEVEFFFIFGG